ncbi:hypothetical protein L208DRAFT_1382454 [Tricholoma matsutake]|nr:hypothetical protein L208DRAFT_1382454 [Tricholoma matsutake 945]
MIRENQKKLKQMANRVRAWLSQLALQADDQSNESISYNHEVMLQSNFDLDLHSECIMDKCPSSVQDNISSAWGSQENHLVKFDPDLYSESIMDKQWFHPDQYSESVMDKVQAVLVPSSWDTSLSLECRLPKNILPQFDMDQSSEDIMEKTNSLIPSSFEVHSSASLMVQKVWLNIQSVFC